MAAVGYRVAWLDSCDQPSRIHLAESTLSLSTRCGHKPDEQPNWKPMQVGMRRRGVSRTCRTCFAGLNPRKFPWHPRCAQPEE